MRASTYFAHIDPGRPLLEQQTYFGSWLLQVCFMADRQIAEAALRKARHACLISLPLDDRLSRGGTTRAVPLGHQRRAMGFVRAPAAGGEDRRPAGEARTPGAGGRDPLHRADGVRVAAAAGGLPALADGVLALQPVGTGQGHREDPAGGARTAPDPGRPHPAAQRRVDRLPERQGRRHRRVRVPRYDAGKKVNGRKRFIVTDTLGLLLTVVVVTASMRDRDGAKPGMLEIYLCTGVRFVFADGAFAGQLLDWAHTLLQTTLHIVCKPADQCGFAVIPRRWAVELTLSWLTAHCPGSPRTAAWCGTTNASP
jgi:hypothetical protein